MIDLGLAEDYVEDVQPNDGWWVDIISILIYLGALLTCPYLI